MRKLFFVFVLFITHQHIISQSVGISNSNNIPDSSAILDINSTTQGVLVPRMTSVEIALIPSPASGLLVYDTDFESFWFYNGIEWVDISVPALNKISDSDNDTRIEVEQNADEDTIRFTVNGVEIGRMDETTFRLNAQLKIGDGYAFPLLDGSPDQVLTTNGDGSLDWKDNDAIGAFERSGALVRQKGNYSDDFIVGRDALPGIGEAVIDTIFFFDKSKAAMRGGNILASRSWEPDSIGISSFGYGTSVLAKGKNSVAFGFSTSATGDFSTAFGWNSAATGSWSTAWGRDVKSTGDYATAWGRNTDAPSGYETVLGRYNTSYVPNSASGWNINDRLFVIANGSSDVARSNAFTVLKNGNIGIGTDVPASTIDVRGSAVFNEDGDDNDFRIESDDNSSMFFVNGGTDRIGIGTSFPLATLDVRGSGLFNNDGSAIHFRVESDNNENMLFVDGVADRVGIGTGVPIRTLDVRGSAVFNDDQDNRSFVIRSENEMNMFYIAANTDRVGIGTNFPTSMLDVRGSAVFNEGSLDADFKIESNSEQNMFYVNGGTNRIGIGTNFPTSMLDVRGSAVFNEGSLDADFRIESNTEQNMFYVNGGNNRIGIGTNSPTATLDIRGSAVFNEAGLDNDFRIESNDNINMFFVDGLQNNIGIGTNAPAANLDVRGSAIFNNDNEAGKNFRIASFGLDNMLFVESASNRIGIGTNSPTATLDVRGSAVFNEQGANNDFRVETNNGVNTFFVNGGTDRVGIGTDEPLAKLDVRGTAVFNEASGDFDFRVESNGNSNMLFVNAGTNRIGIAESAPEAFLHIDSDNSAPVILLEGGGALAGDLTWPSTEHFNIGTWNVVSNTFNELMRIENNGQIGINEISPLAALHIKQFSFDEGLMIENDGDSDTWAFEIGDNDMNWEYNGTSVGFWDDATGNYTATSDRSAKKDITYMTSPVLSKVLKLMPATYRLNHAKANSQKAIGFIAQDVMKQIPELVRHREEGGLAIHYPDFGVYAIKAIQEQQTIINTQNAELLDLQEQNTIMQEQLTVIMSRINSLEEGFKSLQN